MAVNAPFVRNPFDVSYKYNSIKIWMFISTMKKHLLFLDCSGHTSFYF